MPGPDAGSRTPFPDFHVAEGQKLIRDSFGSGGGGETEKMGEFCELCMRLMVSWELSSRAAAHVRRRQIERCRA